MENPLKGITLHSLSIEHRSKIEVFVYDHGCNVKAAVKKALRNGDAITIKGKTIWRENHSILKGPDHEFIWDETGEKLQVQEVLKVRNDKTDELKIIKGRCKYMSYTAYERE